MKWIVALAALLTAAPTVPQVATGPNTPFYAGLPPPDYDGTGAAILVLTDDVSKFCGGAPGGLTVVACVRRTDGGTPILFMPNPRPSALAGNYYARVLYHEMAHVRGWPADHPMPELP